ncbi:hypothetical protein GCM10022252_47840 [Streptosporangium oxazolinicum]|uniref:Uncharacterized protein n=1 Tax=Streptosporangium oxazolinicum TaxID=909287 RepID=A0ABP8B512_9ACTN
MSSRSNNRRSLRGKKAVGVTDLDVDSSGKDSSSEEESAPPPEKTGDESGEVDWDKMMRDLSALSGTTTIDDETAVESTDSEMQRILDDLDALSRGDLRGSPQGIRPERTVSEERQDTEETDELTLSKRGFLTDPGFSMNFDFDLGSPPGVPASKVGLVPHPKFKVLDQASTPVYEKRQDGDIGDVQGEPFRYINQFLYTIGRPVPVRDAKGMPMVACVYIDGGEYFIGRDAFVERTYQRTLQVIDDAEAASDEGLRTFWTKVFEPLQELTEVELSTPLSAVPKSAVDQGRVRSAKLVTVPRGTYRKIGLVNRRVEATQLSPFSLIIEVGGQELVIVPDLIVGALFESQQTDESEEQPDAPEGVDVSEGVDAPEEDPFQAIEVPPQVTEALQQIVPESGKGRAPRLNAKQIMDLFAGSTEFARYVTLPERPDWLRDEHIHYVTQDQLGAVLVLDRMPNDQKEIDDARTNDRFAQSETTNGLQVKEEIYVREDCTGSGTEYHETVHKLSHPAVLDVFGFWFNEGLTEHFTQLLLEGGELVRDKDQYGPQHMAITALMEYAGVTEQELADAYFRGELQPLYDRVASVAVHHPFSQENPFSLDGYAARVDNRRSLTARQTLKEACGFTETETEIEIDDITTADGTIDGTTTTTIDDIVTTGGTPPGGNENTGETGDSGDTGEGFP